MIVLALLFLHIFREWQVNHARRDGKRIRLATPCFFTKKTKKGKNLVKLAVSADAIFYYISPAESASFTRIFPHFLMLSTLQWNKQPSQLYLGK